MAEVVIGGEKHEVPVPNIKAIKKMWPVVQKAQEATDPIEAIAFAINVVAIGLVAKEDPKIDDKAVEEKCDWIEERMTGPEIQSLKDSMRVILREAGILTTGDDAAGEAAGDAPSPSTETSTAS